MTEVFTRSYLTYVARVKKLSTPPSDELDAPGRTIRVL